MNKKIKMIELLNMIANGEEVPKEIIVEKGKYRWDEIKKTYYEPEGLTTLGNAFVLDRMLNNEVEILEDNTEEIEELAEWVTRRDGEVTQQEGKRLEMCYKIDELVKAVNKLRKENK